MQVCDDCFVKIWQQRLKSPVLFGEEQKEYLVSNYKDIQTLCSINTPATTFSGALTKGTIVPSPTTNVPAQTTCAGEFLPVQTGQSSCRKLADDYQVPFGTLRQLSGSQGCLTTAPLCLPPKCELHLVNGGQTCRSVVDQINNKFDSNITMTQLLVWNPYILGRCDNLQDVQQVCRGPPGGAYTMPDPIAAPTAGTYYSTAQPALPTQSGTISDCGRYYDVVADDICQTVAIRFGITVEQLFEYNAYLTKDCMNLWAKSSVCVAKVTVPPVSQNGNCGPDFDFATCAGTTFGKCCSTSGTCGSTEAECGPGTCYSGDCLPGAGSETPDGSCGPAHYDWICGGSSFGKCCSIYGWCGDSVDHCAPGSCHSGDCDQTLGGPSTDGSCGPNFPGDKTCAGTQFGKCCSN